MKSKNEIFNQIEQAELENQVMPIPLEEELHVATKAKPVGTGWLSPMPDLKDHTYDNPEITIFMNKLNLDTKGINVPTKVDLRQWCSPIENQGALGSCTAHAAMSIVEYFERRSFGKHIDGSRLFIYKVTRNLLGWTGDTGAYLRTTMAALRLCGVPPEKYWTYTTNKNSTTQNPKTFDDEPTQFVYALADNYEAINYFSHDPLSRNLPPQTILNNLKLFIAFGIPAMFGYYGFPSHNFGDIPGGIPFPCNNERAIFGHAIAAVGYDDNKKITNRRCNTSTKGALLIRNSWGSNWGDKGYGWLPYDYVLNKFAVDFWSLLKMEWVDSKQFGL